MTLYVASPMTKMSRLDASGSLVIHAGMGDRRGHFVLDGDDAPAIARFLLACNEPASLDAHALALAETSALSIEDAHSLIKHLTAAEALIPAAEAQHLRDVLSPWHTMGWGDAGNFHLATYNLPFDPDVLDGLSYPDYYAKLLTSDDAAGQQPTASVDLTGLGFVDVPASNQRPAPATQLVLASAAPINRFEGPPPTFAAIHSPVNAAFGILRVVGGALGEHHLRSYPSGGARHPFELYIVSKGIAGLDTGIYHFRPGTGQLAVMPGDQASKIDTACFGKGGILSASVVLVLTCRWMRHSWKYRYARSYRMLMLETGHIVQALNLSMLSHGLQTYHCPSIDDRVLREMLGIDDDCAEGPIYALGIGLGGIR